MNRTVRLIAGLVIGCVTAVVVAKAGFSVLRALWPAYSVAEPEKAYTLAMLLSRLTIGALCTAAAACITTLIAADDGRAAWWLGGIFVVVSLPSHLYYVWSDYPVWYHFVYLSYLVPIAGLIGQFLRGSIATTGSKPAQQAAAADAGHGAVRENGSRLGAARAAERQR